MIDYKALYDEAMVASNQAGFVGFTAADTIRQLAEQRADDAKLAPDHEQNEWIRELLRLAQSYAVTRDGTPSKAEAWTALWKHAHNIGPHWRARGYVAGVETSLKRDGLGLLTLEGDCIVMRFTADAAAFSYANDPRFPEPRPPVIDKQLFLRDVFGSLTKEREDGSTRLTDALDWATTDAMEQGSEGIGDMPDPGVEMSLENQGENHG
jgi:hypothetical protein